jgi:hypothetical protein
VRWGHGGGTSQGLCCPVPLQMDGDGSPKAELTLAIASLRLPITASGGCSQSFHRAADGQPGMVVAMLLLGAEIDRQDRDGAPPCLGPAPSRRHIALSLAWSSFLSEPPSCSCAPFQPVGSWGRPAPLRAGCAPMGLWHCNDVVIWLYPGSLGIATTPRLPARSRSSNEKITRIATIQFHPDGRHVSCRGDDVQSYARLRG